MAVIVNWNGVDVPEELKGLKEGRYVLVPIDEPPELTEEEQAGIVRTAPCPKSIQTSPF